MSVYCKSLDRNIIVIKFILSIMMLIYFVSSALAQTTTITPTKEMNLKALLAQSLAEDVQAEAKEIDATNKLLKTISERDWWISCAKQTQCIDWALGKNK